MDDDACARAARDYGGLIHRPPREVHAPLTLDALVVCVRALRAAGTPWVVRGAGHSSGGQPLIHGGAVIDLTGLAAIVRDDGDAITVQAGMTWLALVRHLARDGRRPPVVTDQLRTTIGGTLAVGGVGDTSHVDGLQIDHVLALTLVTPDGEVHRVRAGDELHRFALAGHGQLGVIAEATLATVRRTSTIAARALAYPSVATGLAALEALAAQGVTGPWPFARARLRWKAETRITAVIGGFAADLDAAPPADLGGAIKASAPEAVALIAGDRAADTWQGFAPCAEIVLPRREAAAIWAPLDALVRASGLPAHLPDGASIALVAPGALPLAPSAVSAAGGVVIALRPRIADERVARRVAAWLRGFAARALAGGAWLYPIGEEPDDARWARAQYAAAWPAWLALKDRLDPDRRCHPWRL